MNIALVKNGVSGTRFDETTVKFDITAGQFQVLPTLFIYLKDMGATDYFEIWYTASNNNDIITLSDLQIGSWVQ